MRRVWRELTRHKRQNHRTTNKPFHQRDGPTTLCEKKGAKCLAVNVGKGIWRCRPCGLITCGPPKNIEQRPFPFEKTLIAFLFWSWSCCEPVRLLTKDEVVKLSEAIKMLSPLGSGTPPLSLPPFTEVERHTRRDHVRAYVLQLAEACRALFDSPLYSTIATTASVALNTNVDVAYVREILRTHP